ncbi:MAG: hypothetical protein A2X78_03075 [Gammaproteobacteria bacterium GWE2_37_16]|nr:MAG: hypothetical protein A2X78_03075 [Gammaproteobacteria bacterium GWE2_37_16]
MLAFLFSVVLMQKVETSKILLFKRPFSKEGDKRLVDFFDLLLQWEIEDGQRKKQETKKV